MTPNNLTTVFVGHFCKLPLSLLFIVEVEDVFKLGSVKPGAMLYDANVEYEVFVFLNLVACS